MVSKHGEASNVANHDWVAPVLGRHANRGLDRHIRAPVLDNPLYLSGTDLEWKLKLYIYTGEGGQAKSV